MPKKRKQVNGFVRRPVQTRVPAGTIMKVCGAD